MATRAMAGGVACLFCRLRAKASVGQGSTAARGALRPRGARRGHPGLHRSSPRGAPAAQPDDHGGVPTPAARVLRGERDGKKEEVAGKLTMLSNRAEVDRK